MTRDSNIGNENLLSNLLKFNSETEWIEFKESNSKPDEIGEYLSALANSACLLDQKLGYLVFGIQNDTHLLVGTKFEPKKMKVGNEEFENWLARLLEPRADFEIREFAIDGKCFVIISVDAARERPTKFKGIAYIRVGTYKKKLGDHPEKERKIWQKSGEVSFEDVIALGDLTVEQIMEYLNWRKYFELLNLKLPQNYDEIMDRFCQDLLISKENDKYNITNLGAILFARDIRNFKRISRKTVRVVLYKGKNRVKTVREQEGQFGYASGFEGLIEYVNGVLPSNEEIGQALRKEIKLYPEIAIREVIANALIHQDFEIQGTGPMIEIFDDRIEVFNPGKPLVEPLRFLDHPPRSRNEKLASLMRRLGVCEERGSGIDKVLDAVELFQLPAPLFEEETGFVRVSLFSFRPLAKMNKNDKIRACYQHCALKYVSGESMANQSLRTRLKIDDKNYSIASRIISDTISTGLIKEKDPDGTSTRFTRYVPFWA